MTFWRKLREYLTSNGVGRREFSRKARIAHATFYGWRAGRFPMPEKWPDLIRLGVVRDEAELLQMDRERRERRRKSTLLACPHCGCLIRRRTGKSLDDKFVNPPATIMPVAAHLKQTA